MTAFDSHHLGTFSSFTSPFLMKLFTTSSLQIDKIIKLFKHVISYLLRFMLCIPRVSILYKYNDCRFQIQLFNHLHIGELVGFKLKILKLYIFLCNYRGGGGETYVRPSTFHIGGSPPIFAPTFYASESL